MRKVAMLVVVAALTVALVAGTAAAKDTEKVKTFNFKGTAVSEDGSSISVEVSDGNKRGREATGAHPGVPMVFAVVSGTTSPSTSTTPRRRSPR